LQGSGVAALKRTEGGSFYMWWASFTSRNEKLKYLQRTKLILLFLVLIKNSTIRIDLALKATGVGGLWFSTREAVLACIRGEIVVIHRRLILHEANRRNLSTFLRTSHCILPDTRNDGAETENIMTQ